jgi:hypothetical protein
MQEYARSVSLGARGAGKSKMSWASTRRNCVCANHGRTTVNKLLEGIPSKNFVFVFGGGLYLFGLFAVAVKGF